MILGERMDIWVFPREKITGTQAKNEEGLKIILRKLLIANIHRDMK